jgi:hypothetical protein
VASLFQVPQPSLGLMGRRRDTRNRMPPGMEGMALQGLLPPPADPIDEAMRVRRAEEEALIAAQQQPRQRDRVSGWRILDRVLGGQTITDGLDSERARLQAEADRPRAQAIAMENERIARAMGPQALLALRLNGEQLGAQVSEGFGTDVVAAGSGLFSGGRRVGEQATYAESGDQVLRRDSTGVAPVYTRTAPSIAERTAINVAETGRINATNPMNVAPGGQLRDPRTGALIAEGAPRIFSAADATDLVDETGNPIYQNQRDAPTTPAPATVELQGQLSALDTDVDPVLNEMVSMLDSGDVITGLGAEQRLLAARAAAAVGNADARRQVAATERYLNMAGRLRVGMAKSLGANPSNADLVVLQTVTAGNLDQSAEGLRATLRDGQALSQRQRAALRSRVAPAGSSPGSNSDPVSVSTPQQAQALRPGTRYRTPDGQEYIR